MAKPLLITLLILILILVVKTLGCPPADDYPPLARATGRVTLDGKPLPAGLIVLFKPKLGRPAAGNTDADGYYDMHYRKRRGAIIGRNHVSLQWPTGFQGAVGFPASYGGESDIHVEVTEDGKNVFNIEMSSKD